jgi:AcrR family transcriptional regulator
VTDGGRPAVSEQEKLPRRDQIMAAAKKVFARSGFQATTIADVAKEAQLPFDAVYQYFDSKDALFHALIAAEEYALRTHVAVALAQSGAQFGYAETPFRATLRATFEYFEADKATTAKLLFRDAYQLDKRFDTRLGGIYERFVDDIEALIVAAQKRGNVVAAPPRLVAFTLMALIGQVAQRRLNTDDGVTAGEAADFIGSLVIKGLRPD